MVALYAPVKWPPGIRTVPEIDQEQAGSTPADFVADLTELEGLVHRLAANHAWPPHPFFGRMSESAWLRWGYLHLDHHLRQFQGVACRARSIGRTLLLMIGLGLVLGWVSVFLIPVARDLASPSTSLRGFPSPASSSGWRGDCSRTVSRNATGLLSYLGRNRHPWRGLLVHRSAGRRVARHVRRDSPARRPDSYRRLLHRYSARSRGGVRSGRRLVVPMERSSPWLTSGVPASSLRLRR